jgi:hypothetical protein
MGSSSTVLIAWSHASDAPGVHSKGLAHASLSSALTEVVDDVAREKASCADGSV